MTPTGALQDALAAEHAAVYVFGVLGAQTSEVEQSTLFDNLLTAYEQHRSARDELVARIQELGGRPVAAAPAYELPNAVSTPTQVVRAALVTEHRVTQTYGTLVSQTVGDDRSWAVDALGASAVRQLRFGGRPESFPGTQGLA
ncbi:MAG TPA: ferritin-like domain-containing protein [Marmoricola sp.]